MKKIFILLLVYLILFIDFSPVSATSPMTRTQIRTQIRLLLKDNDDSNPRWSTEILDERISMGELEFAMLTRAVKERSWITTTEDVAEYDLPIRTIAIDRVSYAIKPLTDTTTNYKRIDYHTMNGLDTKWKNWEDRSSSYPQRYCYVGSSTSYMRIHLDPPPDSTYAGTDFLQLDYSIRPSTMTADTDIPFDDRYYLYPYHQAIIWYVVALCHFDTGNLNKGAYFMNAFNVYAEQITGKINTKPDARGGFIPVSANPRSRTR